jgi:cytochrome c oxidase subunit IV
VPVNRAAALTWLFLVVASLATYTIVEGNGLTVTSAVALVVVIAAVKARMIVLHFMEMKHAPRAWRIALELWILIATSLILGFWLLSGGGANCGPP